MRVGATLSLWIGPSLFLAHILVFSPRLWLSPATPPPTLAYLLRGSRNLWVIVALMTYLALSSAPSNRNKHREKCALMYGQADTAVAGVHGRADTPPPCHSGPTGGKDVDYTHFSSSPLLFLPPLTTHPSLSISIMMAAFHRLALLYPLPLLPLAPPYSFTPHSLPLSSFSSRKFAYLAFLASSLLLILLQGFGLEREFQQAVYWKKVKEGGGGRCSCFRARCPPFPWCVIHIQQGWSVFITFFFFTLMLGFRPLGSFRNPLSAKMMSK